MATIAFPLTNSNLTSSNDVREIFTTDSTDETRGTYCRGTDLVTAQDSGQVYSWTGNGTGSLYACLSPDAKYLYVNDVASRILYQHTASTAGDVTTFSYTRSFDYSTLGPTTCRGVGVAGDGSAWYHTASPPSPSSAYRYPMSTPWDISTTGSPNSTDIGTSPSNSYPRSLFWNSDGTRFYVHHSNSTGPDYIISEWTVTSAYNWTGKSYVGRRGQTRSTPVCLFVDGTTAWMGYSGTIWKFALTSSDQFVSTGSAVYSWLVPETNNWVAGIAVNSGKLFIADPYGSTGYVRRYSLSSGELQSLWVPSGFSNMNQNSGSTHQHEYRVNLATPDDTVSYQHRVIRYMSSSALPASGLDPVILAGASSTPASSWLMINSDVEGTSDQTSGPTAYTYVNTSASRENWNGCIVEMRQQISKNMGPDGVQLEVDYLNVVGDYTAAASATITKVNGTAWASTTKVNGVAKASIAKVDGVDAP